MVISVVNLFQVKIGNLNQDIIVKFKEDNEMDHFKNNFVSVDNMNHYVIKANRNPDYKLSFKF